MSTGSSFAYMPAALSHAGRQLHLYLPPKSLTELRDEDTICCIPHSCDCEVPISNLTKPSQQPDYVSPGLMNRSGIGLPCSERYQFPWEVSKKAVTSAGSLHYFNHRVRSNSLWMNSYTRKNTVPVACDGRIYAEYRHKLVELARGIDQGGAASSSSAMLSYEGWLR